MDKGVTIMPAEQVSAQAGRLVLLCKSQRSGDFARREQRTKGKIEVILPYHQKDKVIAKTTDYNFGLSNFCHFQDIHKI